LAHLQIVTSSAKNFIETLPENSYDCVESKALVPSEKYTLFCLQFGPSTKSRNKDILHLEMQKEKKHPDQVSIPTLFLQGLLLDASRKPNGFAGTQSPLKGLRNPPSSPPLVPLQEGGDGD